jgi:hypothetical protein
MPKMKPRVERPFSAATVEHEPVSSAKQAETSVAGGRALFEDLL